MILVVDNASEFMAGVDAFASSIIAGTRTVVSETCEESAAHGRQVGAFKDQTGSLRRSIVGRVVRRDASGTSGVIEATAPHARFVEDDTAPHVIRPRSARALRWEEGGEVHFARVVRHPGTRGNPFMGPAAIKAEAMLYARMESVTARAIARAHV